MNDENRNIEETKIILEKFSGGPIGYWHDTGHAAIFEKLGFVQSHYVFLENFSSKMIGMHLHDLHKFSDHYAPGTGDFDFSSLKPFIPNNIPLVIEAHPKCSIEQIKESVEYLEKIDIVRPEN